MVHSFCEILCIAVKIFSFAVGFYMEFIIYWRRNKRSQFCLYYSILHKFLVLIKDVKGSERILTLGKEFNNTETNQSSCKTLSPFKILNNSEKNLYPYLKKLKIKTNFLFSKPNVKIHGSEIKDSFLNQGVRKLKRYWWKIYAGTHIIQSLF